MRENPERFALNVVLTAFTVFLLLCGGVIYGVQWFILQSQVPMDITLKVSRGTVSIVPPETEEAIAVTDQRDALEIGTRITTDASSQGLLSFKDPRTDRVVAEWVLHHDSDITLSNALAPRFGLNAKPYTVAGVSGSGNTEILLLPSISRPVNFEVDAGYAMAAFSREGHYLVDVSEETSRITTRQGTAEITNESQRSVSLEPDELVTIIEEDGEMIVESSEQNFIENSVFRLPDMAGWDVYTLGSDPQGQISSIIFDGRPVVFLDRPLELFENELDHGEVGLEQSLDLSTRNLFYLEVRATFRATQQSLSTCGFEGSECPLMIRMDYLDAEENERVWIHGFYVNHNPALEYPLRCDTCAIDHERILPDRWHTFESGNLMALLPAEQKPAMITDVRVYASGHAFKVYVAEMSLLGAS
jgi:hypothetical protein